MPLDAGEALANGLALVSLIGKCVSTARSQPAEMDDIGVWAQVIRVHLDEIETTARAIKTDVKD